MRILATLVLFLSLIVVNCSTFPLRLDENLSSVDVEIYKSEILAVKPLGNNEYEVTGEVFIQNITPEEARVKAIAQACRSAVEFHSGVEINSRTFSFLSESNNIVIDSFSSITNQLSTGIITEKILLSENVISVGDILAKVVRLRVKVENQKGVHDPYFNIEVRLNREYYQSGEGLQLTLKSTKNCYITVFNISSNDSVYILFPNQYQKTNFLKAGDTFTMPNGEALNLGLTYRVGLLPGKEQDVELIKIIATKQRMDFTSFYTMSAFGTYQAAHNSLQKWLIKIPRDEMEEVDMQYFIVK
jgi:hypothetical protein